MYEDVIDTDGVPRPDPTVQYRKCSHCGRGYRPDEGSGAHCPGCAELKFGRQAELGEYAGRR